jgi:hypothetical protein
MGPAQRRLPAGPPVRQRGYTLPLLIAARLPGSGPLLPHGSDEQRPRHVAMVTACWPTQAHERLSRQNIRIRLAPRIIHHGARSRRQGRKKGSELGKSAAYVIRFPPVIRLPALQEVKVAAQALTLLWAIPAS